MTAPFPTRDDLLATVSEFLAKLRPTLSGELRYQAQVAYYLVDIVRREADGAGNDTLGDLTAFRDAMRAGRLDDDATLAETLLANAVADVRIVRPDQLDPMHRPEPP